MRRVRRLLEWIARRAGWVTRWEYQRALVALQIKQDQLDHVLAGGTLRDVSDDPLKQLIYDSVEVEYTDAGRQEIPV